MTIAMIGQKGLPARSGGIEHHVQALAKGLVSRGHRVVVFGRSWYVQSSQPPVGVEQVCTQGIRTKHLDAITHSCTALLAARRFNPDIIHIHGVGIALLAPLARLLYPRTKLVVTFHCMDRRFSKWGWFARLSFRIGEWITCRFAHEVVTVSKELQEYCAAEYGRTTAHISHAFSFERLADEVALKQRLAALDLAPNGYMLFVGRLLPHKGAHRFLAAFKQAYAIDSAAMSGLKAVIVGGSSFTDEYSQSVRRQMEGVANAVWLGERFDGDLRALQTGALAHVFPTTEEGLSLSLLEASSTGRPVITHDIQANREATGGHAHTIDALDQAALAQAFVDVARASEADRAKQGEALAAHVAHAFNAQRNLDAMETMYHKLLQGTEGLEPRFIAE